MMVVVVLVTVVPERFFHDLFGKVLSLYTARVASIDEELMSDEPTTTKRSDVIAIIFLFFLFSSIFSSPVGRYVNIRISLRQTDLVCIIFEYQRVAHAPRYIPSRRRKPILGAELFGKSYAKCRMSPIRSNMIT